MPVLRKASEYAGQSAIQVECTQLGGGYTPVQARRIVAGWVELLSGEQTELRDLEFVSRTPKRLFAALSGQTQLRRLVVKWGDYDDLSSLQGLRGLERLELRGAYAVADVKPLAALDQPKALVIEGFRSLDDPTPLGRLNQLTDLDLGGDWMAPRNAHIGSIGFLRELKQLEKLLLHTIIVEDRDYSALLSMPNLKWVRVMETKGMQPSIDHLKRTPPWGS